MKKSKDVDVIMPRLVKGKTWHVVYECYFPRTGKLEKFRIYKGLREIEDLNEREKYADKIMKAYAKKLTAGWRPWDPTVFIYQDETQYRNVTMRIGNEAHNNSHIRKNLSAFLIETKRVVSAKTYESYQSKTRLFCEWLENNGYAKLRIFEIKQPIVRKFFDYLIDTRKLDPRTIEKYEQNIKKMFIYFKKCKLTDEVPLEKIEKPPKIKDMAARPIMDEDMKVLLKHLAVKDPQLFVACLVQFFLCCRPGNELRLLKGSDLDFSMNVIHISQTSGKKGKRIITMPEALVELLKQFEIDKYAREDYIFSRHGKPGPSPLGKNYFSRKFAKYRDDLNLSKNLKFYSFKHTGAGKLLESGATLIELMSHLGHRRMESTFHYIRRHFGEKSEKILNFKPDVLSGFLK